jgi:hypothetical protein
MADIFISYAREDRPRVEPLSKALKEQGWSVFWDRTIPAGKTWRQVIGEALGTARSIIVVWSKASVESRWVQEKADRGLERNILIPLLIDNVNPPLGFGAIQTADLISWESTQSSPEFEKLISDLSAILGPSPLNVRETEQKRAEEEVRHRQDEERDRRKEEQWKAEEERKQKEGEEKRISEEERKRREEKAKIKPDKPGPDAPALSKPKSPEPRKTSNAMKLGAVAGVIVLLIFGIWWWISESQKKKHQIEVERKIEHILEEIALLEQTVSKTESLEQLNDSYKKSDVLGRKLSDIEQMSAVVGVSQKAEKAHKRLEELSRLLITQKQKAAEEEPIRKAEQVRLEEEKRRMAEQAPYYKKMSFGFNGCDVKFGDLKKGVRKDYMIRLATKVDAEGFTYHPSLKYGKLIIGDYPKGCKSPSNMSWPLYLKVN